MILKNSTQKGVFITATDTDVGKTLVSAWLAIHTQAAYYKPIQCGVPTDSEQIATLTKEAGSSCVIVPETYRFAHPVSPHLAAQLTTPAVTISRDAILRRYASVQHLQLIVEGAGGVLVPLNANDTMLDVMVRLGLPIVLVTRGTLGTINHTSLTIEALRARSLTIKGIVISGELQAGNHEAITHYTQTPIIATLPPLPAITGKTLKAIPLPNALQQLLTP